MPLYPPSNLDANQVIQHVYDESTQTLRTQATATIITPPQLQVLIDASEDSVRLGDGSKLNTLTTVSGKNGVDVNVLNTLTSSPSGLSTGLKTSRVIITDVAQKVPATALANRNAISIRVLGINTVYFGNSTLTTSNGYPKFQYEEITADIKDNASVDIYAVCEAGRTCEIAILEIA